MIQIGSNIGRLARLVIRTFTRMLRHLPVTYCWQASDSDASKPCRASGRAYLRGTTNRSKMTLFKSILSGGAAEAKSNGQIAAVSAPVNAALAPTNRPEYSPSCWPETGYQLARAVGGVWLLSAVQ